MDLNDKEGDNMFKKFDFEELAKMEKPALMLHITALYAELEKRKDIKQHKAGVYMNATAPKVNQYYKGMLKSLREDE